MPSERSSKGSNPPWGIFLVFALLILILPSRGFSHRLPFPKVMALFLLADRIEARINYTVPEGEEFLRFQKAFGGDPEKMKTAILGAGTSSLKVFLNGKTVGMSVTRASAADTPGLGPFSLDIFLTSQKISYVQGDNALEVRDFLKAWGLRAPEDAAHMHSAVPVIVHAGKGLTLLNASAGELIEGQGTLKDIFLSKGKPLTLALSLK